MVNNGSVRRMTHASESSSSTRVRHRAEETKAAGARLLVGGQLTRQDRDEDDVVDAQDDFQERQGCERNPDLRVGKPLHQHSSEKTNTCRVKPSGQTPYSSAFHSRPSSVGGAMYPTSAEAATTAGLAR